MSTVRTVRRLVALVSLGAVSLAPFPAAALANNGTSAGDQQYVDPLSGSSAPAASSPSPSGTGSGSSSSASSGAGSSTSSGSGSGSGTPAATASGSSGATLTASAGSTTAVGGTAAASGRTLPFTGYDGGLAIALGSGLVAGGVLLRRRLAATDR